MQDHLQGLADAIEAGDDEAAKRHLMGLAAFVLGALNSMALSLDKIAHPDLTVVQG